VLVARQTVVEASVAGRGQVPMARVRVRGQTVVVEPSSLPGAVRVVMMPQGPEHDVAVVHGGNGAR
jgi:hypothetical protein